MLLKSLNYAIDSIQGEKFSLNFSRELENFLKNCSKWKIFDQFLDRFLENLRRWNYVSLCERRKKRNSNRWMDEIISRNNRLQSYRRFFKKLLSHCPQLEGKKNISLMHVPSSSYQLEETRTFKSRCKSEKGNVSSS